LTNKPHSCGGSPAEIDFNRGESDPRSAIRHALRTPLNQIIGYSELCQEVAEDLVMDKLKADLQKITTAANNLLALFDSKSFPTQLEISTHGTKPGASANVTLGRSISNTDQASGVLHQGNILIVDGNAAFASQPGVPRHQHGRAWFSHRTQRPHCASPGGPFFGLQPAPGKGRLRLLEQPGV